MFHWLRGKTEAKAATLAHPSDDLLRYFGVAQSTAAGVAVTPESAVRVPAVACAIRCIAEALGQLPLHTYERAANGERERNTTHPAAVLINSAPNDWTSGFELRRDLAIDALRTNDALAFVNRDTDGTVREIIRLRPGTMRIDVDDATGEPSYSQVTATGTRRFARESIIHIRGPFERSAVALASEAISLALSQERHAGQLFGRGARPSGVLRFKKRLTDEVYKRLLASWGKAHTGDAAGGTAILEDDAEWTPITFNSVDLQFQQLREFQIAEIARAFRVPPVLLMDYGRATWSNSEEMGRQFLIYTLSPWVHAFEGAFNRAVFTREERGRLFCEFQVDAFERADLSKRLSAYSAGIAARIYSPNEVRAKENMPPYEGGDEFANPNTTPAAPASDDGAKP